MLQTTRRPGDVVIGNPGSRDWRSEQPGPLRVIKSRTEMSATTAAFVGSGHCTKPRTESTPSKSVRVPSDGWTNKYAFLRSINAN
jgi:hypothetical protein